MGHAVPGEKRGEQFQSAQSAVVLVASLPIDHSVHALQYLKIKDKI